MAGCLLAGLPAVARSATEVAAWRGNPSALTATYGPAVDLPALPGRFAVPTGSGVEILDASTLPGTLTSRGGFRTAGAIRRAAAWTTHLFLFAGDRGVLALDASGSGAPALEGSVDGLGAVSLGAAATTWPGVVAAGDSTLHFLAFDPASGFSKLRSVTFSDGRRIVAVAASSDSFLVASDRAGVIPRVIFTLYRLRSGAAAPDSLGEFAFNGHEATDLAWPGGLAFVGDGNDGIFVVSVASRSIVRTVAVPGGKFVSSVAATGSYVAASAAGRTALTYQRAGAALDSLVLLKSYLTGLEAIAARFAAGAVAVSTVDTEAPLEPDEVAASQVELLDPLGVATPPPPAGGVGRARRVATGGGLAYVADYSGGLRVYRVAGSDTSLVGVLPAPPNGRAVDVALDPARGLAYLASGAAGLDVVDVRDPAAPARLATLPIPGLAAAVTVAGPDLVAVGRRSRGGADVAGVTFVDVADSTQPAIRGGVDAPFQDVRAVAARDTVLFVADEGLGVVSVGFGDPDLPERIGLPSNEGARALDLTGTTLLVGTRAAGLQVVDVSNPTAPLLRGTLPVPPILGIARSGGSAALFLGEAGTLVADVTNAGAPASLGPIAAPGVPRGGAWVGDSLLVAAGLGLERFLVSPGAAALPALTVTLDPASALPRARISWSPVSLAGIVGLNLYRDLGAATSGTGTPTGRLVNAALLPASTVATEDDSLTAGAIHRYRLEACVADGGAVDVAEGSIVVPGSARVGRPFPNPFRPRSGATASIPFRVASPPAGAVVTLRVYDVAGRIVRSISAPVPPGAGFGAVEWDGKDAGGHLLPDAIYFLKLTGSGLDDARTIVLLR